MGYIFGSYTREGMRVVVVVVVRGYLYGPKVECQYLSIGDLMPRDGVLCSGGERRRKNNSTFRSRFWNKKNCGNEPLKPIFSAECTVVKVGGRSSVNLLNCYGVNF